MKGIQLENGIKKYNSVPKKWGNIIGGFNYLSDSDLEGYGFYDIVTPSITESQELGDIEWDADNSVFTFPVQSKTFTETIAELKTQKIESLKHSYSRELAKTDWYIIRAQEGISIPQAITDVRTGLRSDCAIKETEIKALSTKAQIVEYSSLNFI